VDPVVVDEAPDRVKITGFKSVRRRVISHALNQIASARRYAAEIETFYEKVNVISGPPGGRHLHRRPQEGRLHRRQHDALDGEGPFTPERSGSLPVGRLVDLCFSGQYTKAELRKLIKGKGGLIDLLGTSDLRQLQKRYEEGDLRGRFRAGRLRLPDIQVDLLHGARLRRESGSTASS
jgi:butyrate kinase